MSDKPKLMILTDPAEIDAVRIGCETGNVKSPLGDIINGVCYAYTWSVLRWREFNRAAAKE
jgi:hypothetical protein